MSAITDDHFTYSVVSIADKKLAITGLNPANPTYSSSNANMGLFPAITSTYTGSNPAYNGNGNSANAFKIVEIIAFAFDSKTAFAETTLSSTFFPANLKVIGESAFSNVKLKGTLTIPATIESVGVKAFYNTLITDIVIGSSTNSDIVAHLANLTATINEEINARIAGDDLLNSLKAPIESPVFTGTATIPNASIGLATISSASIASANIDNANIASASITTVNVIGNAAFGGNVSTTGAWNFTSQPRINSEFVATESYTNAKITSIAGSGLSSTLDTLAELANAIGNNPSFATNIINSHMSLSSMLSNETTTHIASVSSLSSALSTHVVSLPSVDSILSSAISFETHTRSVSISSLSSAISSAVSSFQSLKSGMSSTLSTEINARSTDIYTTSSLLSSTVSSLQSVNSVLSTAISTEINSRSSAVASLAPLIDASATSLSTVDANLKTALFTETSKRDSAIASIHPQQSISFASLAGVDSTLSGALSTEIGARISSISSLSVSASSASDSLQLTNLQFSIALAAEVGTRSASISSISSSASSTVSTFISINSVISTTLSTEVSTRGSAVSSASISINNAAPPLNTSITAHTNALATETIIRNNQINSISAGVSLSAASLTTANATVSDGLTAENLNRSVAINAAIANVLSGAPSRFNTLEKIANELQTASNIKLTSSALSQVASLNAGVTGEITTRISAIASVSNSAIPSLSAVNAGMNTALTAETTTRGSATASLSSALSSASVSFADVDTVLSGALSTEALNRNSTILSVSAAISTTTSTLTATDVVLSTGLSIEIINRQSTIISLFSAMSGSVAALDVVKGSLSTALNSESSNRIASTGSLLSAISLSLTSLQVADSALKSSVSALSAELTTKATTSYLDGKISNLLNGAPAHLNTLVEMAAALGNNPSFASSIIGVLSTKAETSLVNSISTTIAGKGGLTEFTSLASIVSNKANSASIATVNNSLTLFFNTVNALASTVSALTTTGGTINANAVDVSGVTIPILFNRIQELYYNVGTANPGLNLVNGDGTVNYKHTSLANPSLVNDTLGFEYNASGAVTKVLHLITVKFDKDQKNVTLTGGVGNPTVSINNMALDSNRNYLFTLTYNGDTNYYTANKTGVTITALDSTYRLAPANPTIVLSELALYKHATPTATVSSTTSWNPTTQIITNPITVSVEDSSAVLQFALGGYSTSDVTIEAASGATAVAGETNRFTVSSTSATFNVKYARNLVQIGTKAILVNIMGSYSKLPSDWLTISSVINDMPQFEQPTIVANSKTVSKSGSTYTYTATFTNADGAVMEVLNADNSVASVQPTVGAAYAYTYDSSKIGSTIFKINVKDASSKRASTYLNVSGENIPQFGTPVLSGTVAYSGSSPFTATATYTVAANVNSVKIVKSDSTFTTQSVSSGTVVITVSYTDSDISNARTFHVMAVSNNFGSDSAASVSQPLLDPPLPVLSSFTTTTATFSGIRQTRMAMSGGVGQYQIIVSDFEEYSVKVSANKGVTWNSPTPNVYGALASVSMDASGKYQAIIGPSRICRSDNYGSSFTDFTAVNFAGANFRKICLSSNGSIAIIVNSATSVMKRSTNFNTSLVNNIIWTDTALQSGAGSAIHMSLNGKYITYGVWNGGVYVSSDYGSTFTPVNSTQAPTGMYAQIVISSDGKYQTVCAHYKPIIVSSNYGASWSPATSPSLASLACTNLSMSWDGKYQIAAYGGAKTYSSSDYGATWNLVATGYGSPSDVYGIAMSSNGQLQIVGGTVAGNNIRYSGDFGATWNSNVVTLS